MDILKHFDASSPTSTLELVRLDNNENALILFTPEATPVKLHYCPEPEISGYVHCNGSGCVLCRVGRELSERILLPAYQPVSRSIGVLAIPPSSRPGALLPQVLAILRSRQPVVVIAKRVDRVKFSLSTVELVDGMDDGADVIAAFVRSYEVQQIDLASVYARIANSDLATIPPIAKMLRLKGINPADVD